MNWTCMIIKCVVKSADRIRVPNSFTCLTLWKKTLVEALDASLGWQGDAELCNLCGYRTEAERAGPYCPNDFQESVAYLILKENNKKWQPFPSFLSISLCSSFYLLKFLLVNPISSLGLNLHGLRVWNHEFRNPALPLNRFCLPGKPYVSGFPQVKGAALYSRLHVTQELQ